MTRYIVAFDNTDDLIIEDPTLELDLRAEWAVFNDSAGLALAIPIDRIRSIQRLVDQAPVEEGGG
ncbi:hypothetical protein ACFWMG_04675 [Streptomyces sp. NPDC127074]|uniref:hypothetical protein n=1 Tax=Streptomyces sp. NPDC127074 TaxID=3347130 RepID=UPI00364F67E8